ncbi:MAG TPA: cellulose binding domain-containing protein, partial [Cellvibrio sp.]
MSNNKSIFKKVMRCVYPLGVCFFASISPSNAHSACLYSVNSQWNGGFNATIKITNNNSTAINAWSVNWQYAGQDRIASAYNTTLTGSNPYTAANLGWNGSLQPGQSIEFGLNGNKGSAAAEIPVLTGNICGAISSSSQAKSSVASVSSSNVTVSSSSVVVSSSSRIASSSIPVISSSKSSSSSVASVGAFSSSKASSSIISSSVHSSSSDTNSSVVSGIGNWNLDSTNSHLSFATTKNVNTVESHTFTGIS